MITLQRFRCLFFVGVLFYTYIFVKTVLCVAFAPQGSFNWSILQEKLWIFESFILKNVNVIYVKNESAMSSAMFLSKHVSSQNVTYMWHVARSQAWERVEIDKCKVMVNARVRAAKRIKRGVLQLRILSVHKDAEGYLSHYYESSGPWSWMSLSINHPKPH